MTIPAYFIDIDGTLADCSHRLHHILNAPKDWRGFFEACGRDPPIPHVVQLVRHLDTHAPIVFLTGRSDVVKAKTRIWILKHVTFRDFALYMREDGDHRDDSVVKLELMQRARADGYLRTASASWICGGRTASRAHRSRREIFDR